MGEKVKLPEIMYIDYNVLSTKPPGGDGHIGQPL